MTMTQEETKMARPVNYDEKINKLKEKLEKLQAKTKQVKEELATLEAEKKQNRVAELDNYLEANNLSLDDLFNLIKK